MRKVGIIGLGNVGATVAYTLFTHGLADELVLIDLNEKKRDAEFNDLRDAAARNDKYVKVDAGEYADLADADLVVTAFGSIKASVESGDRFAEFPINTKNAKQVGPAIKASGFHGILLNITNPCDAVTTILQQTTGLPKEHVFGTGTFLDTARMQRIIGEKFEINPRSVDGFVLGEHGASQFTAWSTITAGGQTVTKMLSEDERKELSQQPNKNAFKVADGKGFTNWAVASCAAKLVEMVFSNAHAYVPASVYVPALGTYLGYPAVIGWNGVEKVGNLELPADEQKQLEESANYVKSHLAKFA